MSNFSAEPSPRMVTERLEIEAFLEEQNGTRGIPMFIHEYELLVLGWRANKSKQSQEAQSQPVSQSEPMPGQILEPNSK